MVKSTKIIQNSLPSFLSVIIMLFNVFNGEVRTESYVIFLAIWLYLTVCAMH